MPQNARSVFQYSGVWPYKLNNLSDCAPVSVTDRPYHDCAPASLTDRPYHDCTPASPTQPPQSELPQLCPEKVSLSRTSTDLVTDSMTYCHQSKSGPSTIYSPHDIRHCPTAQKSVKIGWKRKFQWTEILTRSPVKKTAKRQIWKERKTKSAKFVHKPSRELFCR